MRKIFTLIILFISCLSNSQNFSSLEQAKNEAITKNKLILIQYYSDYGYKPLKRLNDECWNDNEINELTSQYVVLRIQVYPKPIVVQGRESITYEPNNEYISIADANGKKLSLLDFNTNATSVNRMLKKFLFPTEYLSKELTAYHRTKNFNTAMMVSERYFDFSLLVSNDVKSDVLNVGSDYLAEAKQLLSGKDVGYIHKKQKFDLMKIAKLAYLFDFEKLDAKLSKFEEDKLSEENRKYFIFLKYISAKALNKKDFLPLEEKVNKMNGFEVYISKANLILSKQY